MAPNPAPETTDDQGQQQHRQKVREAGGDPVIKARLLVAGTEAGREVAAQVIAGAPGVGGQYRQVLVAAVDHGRDTDRQQRQQLYLADTTLAARRR
jgi:hypothetical protein